MAAARTLLLAAVCAAALTVVAAGCGDDSGGGGAEEPEPLAAPKAKEKIEEAQKRIAKAVASDGCKGFYELNLIASKTLDVKRRCVALRTQLEGAEPSGAEGYAGGGVIDYERDQGPLTAMLVVDRDGRYHLAELDPYLQEQSAGTKFAKQFDRAAKRAVEALVDGDCQKFLEVAHARFGPGAAAAPRQTPCAYAEDNPIATIAEMNPEAKPKKLGGNRDYAFYGFGAPGVHYTMLMARQSDENIPPTSVAPRLPADAPEYAYVTAYETDLARKGS